ncbi:hypothetical protein FGO68_gene1100 [Halteria grandinella]|uniref:Uncharacterized protein n=1 Tax=Halteria grandinella TaxID=5974 RepID=A0A8J8NV30_HALGN|nr:hypothetical protein FGO68_gene1100 [Halteria grandinella]
MDDCQEVGEGWLVDQPMIQTKLRERKFYCIPPRPASDQKRASILNAWFPRSIFRSFQGPQACIIHLNQLYLNFLYSIIAVNIMHPL